LGQIEDVQSVQASESTRCPCYDVVRAFTPMQPIYSLREPIRDPGVYQAELAGLQGNILHNHGRRHAAHIFLRFNESANWLEVRQRIARFAPSVTSAWEQIAEIREGKQDRLFTGVCLSKSGYDFLRIPTSGFIGEFTRGMRGSANRLGILHDTWEAHLVDPDMLIIVAHRDHDAAVSACSDVIDLFSDLAQTIVEWGHVISDTPGGQVKEHFGFADGLSQPRFIREANQPDATYWDEGAGPWLVLASIEIQPGICDVGSYYVYWKLEQDVGGFETAVQTLAVRLGVSPELAGAFVFGRFKDGTPLVKGSLPRGEHTPLNDFDYSDDPLGRSCPIFAHIRKMNPRGTSRTEFETERARRIARRGITYGYNPEVEKRPDHGIGLLFQSCQSDFARQFEHLVGMWGKDRGFPGMDDGADPLLGASHETQQWPRGNGGPGLVNHSFGSCVQSLGGAYLFIPGKTFLGAIDRICLG
jgi:deferrochelatase/peroxidase EfeB